MRKRKITIYFLFLRYFASASSTSEGGRMQLNYGSPQKTIPQNPVGFLETLKSYYFDHFLFFFHQTFYKITFCQFTGLVFWYQCESSMLYGGALATFFTFFSKKRVEVLENMRFYKIKPHIFQNSKNLVYHIYNKPPRFALRLLEKLVRKISGTFS